MSSCPRYRVPEHLRKELAEQRRRLARLFLAMGIASERVVEAFLRVPREEFVLPDYVPWAYVDSPLPLFKGATISAPSMCVLFLEYAKDKLVPGAEVFEVGTGSGYQAALIAEMVADRERDYGARKPVCTIEIDPDLYRFGKENLERLCYSKCVDVRCGDGTQGWPDKGRKFDVVIVTAAGRVIPPPLIDQLKVGGILLMPLEVSGEDWQWLIRVRKTGSGANDYKIEFLEPVRFVPLRGRYGIS